LIDLIQANWTLATKNFDAKCDKVGLFLDKNPTCFKTVLFASHLFRATSMYGMMECLPFSLPVTAGLMIFSSVLYRASIERFCSFRFTLPSLAGGVALWGAKNAAILILSKAAFSSIGAFFSAGLGIACLAGYLVFICKVSDSDVEKYMSRFNKKICCH